MIYNIILSIAYFFVRIFSYFNKRTRDFFWKRVFNIEPIEEGKYILIHASSLGEINLLDSFIQKIQKNQSKKIIISVVTDTGYNQALLKYKNPNVKVIYFPLDNYLAIKKLFSKVTLEKTIIVETEIWPNLINYTNKNSKLYLINGRISEKSFRKYSKVKHYLKPFLNKFEYFIMQTEEDKEKIIKLGVKSEKVYNFGNLKFDIKFDNYSEEELLSFREKLGIDKKVFVAGSTRDGEEEIILEVFKKLKGYKLLLVPRHLQRIRQIEELLNGESYSLYSQGIKESDIIIVDTMGILRKCYAIADISFVGGTLVNIGGHSLLEPLYYGKKPIFGKYLQNVKDIANEMLKLGLGYKVENVDEFYKAIGFIEKETYSCELIKDFLERNSKSSDRSYKLIFEE